MLKQAPKGGGLQLGACGVGHGAAGSAGGRVRVSMDLER